MGEPRSTWRRPLTTFIKRYKKNGGGAWVSVNKALVTRASAVIPGVSLYLALLSEELTHRGLEEGTIEQIHRLFATKLYAEPAPPTDGDRRIRMDDYEMRSEVQDAVARRWEEVIATDFSAATTTVKDLVDVDAFMRDFLRVHGFGFEGIDYTRDVEP